jgi:hypothetical protein
MSAIHGYCTGRSIDKEASAESNEDSIDESSAKDGEDAEGQGNSSAAKEEQSAKEEEGDVYVDQNEREKRSPVMRRQAWHGFVDERGIRLEEVTWSDDKQARIKEEVLEVVTGVLNPNNQYNTLLN